MGKNEKDDNFEHSGPTHMRSKAGKIIVDWNKAEDRRCAMACLVRGTSVMENDRAKCRMYNNEELARAWWESFSFSLEKQFIDDSDKNHKFSYGAIFKLMEPRHPSAPKYVVAFRGTMLWRPKAVQDLKEDLLVLLNSLPYCSRFKRTFSEVCELIGNPGQGPSSVWLAGHSLGASMALQIGRQIMQDKGINVPTFLFNPPHVSLAPVIDEVLDGKAKTVLYAASYMVKFVLAQVLSEERKRTKKLFERLAPWVPELYVNPNDGICLGYIQYFEQRQLVAKEHPRWTSTASRMSYRDVLFNMIGCNKSRPHLLPSARLWKNQDQEDAHGLQQWWKSDSDMVLSSRPYRYVHNASA